VSIDDLHQNINIKQAIEDFTEKNPWAYEYQVKDEIEENYQNIEF